MRIVMAGVAFVLSALVAGPALAACDFQTAPMPVGAVTGDAERDSVGFVCTAPDPERTGSVLGASRGRIALIGPGNGEAEQDTVGYVTMAGVE